MIMIEPGDVKTKPFVGAIVRTPKDRMGIVLRVNEKSVSGLFLDGNIDCMYRYCNIVKATTRKGFSYRGKTSLDFCGFIDGERLAEVISVADTGKSFGSGGCHLE